MHPTPTIVVSVSDDLRTLWTASTAGSLADPVADGGPDAGVGWPFESRRSRQAAAGPAPSSSILLRRDGMRPLRFNGMLLVDIATSISPPSRPYDHHLRVYRTDDGALVLAVQLVAQQEGGPRPRHRAERVTDLPAASAFLERWVHDVLHDVLSLEQPPRPSVHSNAAPWAIDTFHTATANMMRLPLPTSERKYPCLQ